MIKDTSFNVSYSFHFYDANCRRRALMGISCSGLGVILILAGIFVVFNHRVTFVGH
jgi:hypothetical protein